MKKIPLLSLGLGLATLVSCQKEGLLQAPAGLASQTWQLVKLTGQIPGYVKTGADLPWQEHYVFQADSTFTKTRQQGDAVVEAHGTFAVRDFSDGPYAVLTYDVANSLIGSCRPSTLTETLALKADETLESTWRACDGPGLEYKRVK